MRNLTKLFSAAAVLFSTASFGLNVHLGLQGGVSISNFSAPTGITADNVTGFAAGILVELPLNESVAIQPEALFVQKGADLAGSGAVNVSSKLNSLDVPIFLKLSLGKDIRPYVFLGPNFSFTLSSSLQANAGGSMGTLSFSPNTYDLGFAGGAGAEFGPIFVNVRYLAGVLNINNGAASWSSRGLLALAGLKF